MPLGSGKFQLAGVQLDPYPTGFAPVAIPQVKPCKLPGFGAVRNAICTECITKILTQVAARDSGARRGARRENIVPGDLRPASGKVLRQKTRRPEGYLVPVGEDLLGFLHLLIQTGKVESQFPGSAGNLNLNG